MKRCCRTVPAVKCCGGAPRFEEIRFGKGMLSSNTGERVQELVDEIVLPSNTTNACQVILNKHVYALKNVSIN